MNAKICFQMTARKMQKLSFKYPPPPPCTPTQVPNSNKAGKGSITGKYEAQVTVACNKGYLGGGVMTCVEKKKWVGKNSCDKPLKPMATSCFERGGCGTNGVAADAHGIHSLRGAGDRR